MASSKISFAGSDGSLGALGPPMSVLTHPGLSDETMIFLDFNWLARTLVYIFRAAFDIE